MSNEETDRQIREQVIRAQKEAGEQQARQKNAQAAVEASAEAEK